MAFPTLSATATGDNAASTTRTLTLPSGVASGNLLLGILAVGQAMSYTWPAGWTEFDGQGGTYTVSLGYRIADGTEGATIDVTSSAAGRASVFQVHRFSGGTFSAPQQAGANMSNTDAYDPPNLAPSWAQTDVTWCAVAGHGNRGSTIAGVYPTNYASNQTETISTLEALGGGIQFATYDLNAASENPGAYPVIGVAGRAFTIGIAFAPPGNAARFMSYQRMRKA